MTRNNNMTHSIRNPLPMLTVCSAITLLLTGCTTSSDGLDTSPASTNEPFVGNYLTGDGFRQKIVGNTLVGRIPNYPKVGPIRFKVYHKADGTLSDLLFFERTGKTGRDIGVWRIKDEEQGIICTRYKKRLGSNEYCHRFQLSEDGRFQRFNMTTGKIGTNGTVLPGNEVN